MGAASKKIEFSNRQAKTLAYRSGINCANIVDAYFRIRMVSLVRFSIPIDNFRGKKGMKARFLKPF